MYIPLAAHEKNFMFYFQKYDVQSLQPAHLIPYVKYGVILNKQPIFII